MYLRSPPAQISGTSTPRSDRIAGDNTGSSLGGTIQAEDTITIFDKWPTPLCGLGVADQLAVLTFSNTPPTVFHLAVLLWMLCENFSEYKMYTTMCYWHARMVFQILRLRFDGTEILDPLSHSRMGTYRKLSVLDGDFIYHFAGIRDQLEKYGVIDIADEPEVEAEVLAERASAQGVSKIRNFLMGTGRGGSRPSLKKKFGRKFESWSYKPNSHEKRLVAESRKFGSRLRRRIYTFKREIWPSKCPKVELGLNLNR
ncbi:hypothetical protein DFH06DRAFT_1291845 [Mycena polygramma]|nr:hypothetical protein DFH06DRAFT_1291845 [Mycena polygramma]